MKEQLQPVLQVQGENSPLAQVGDMISPIQPSHVLDFANPVEAEIVLVHEAGELSNAPIAYGMVTWLTSLIGAVVLYLVEAKRSFTSRTEKLKFNTIQSILPFVYALITGYVLVWYSMWLYGFEFIHVNRVALFIAICVAAFTFLIYGTLRWLKLPSIVIYILLMFFSMPAIQLIPEMMPAFYRDYIVSWLPMRIYAEEIREVLFFSQELFNSYSVILIWVMVIGIVLVWVKNLMEKVAAK